METSSKWADTFLDQKRLIGDPEADELLIQIIKKKEPADSRRLFDLLIRNIELPINALPTEVIPFLQKNNQLPTWTDPTKVQLAHDLFLDHGAKFLIFLYFKSLPLLYTCKNGAAVLVQTSRLTNSQQDLEIFTRRIAETGQFLIDTMTPQALLPEAKGIQSIQKVRLIHAAIRYFIQEKDWDANILGIPINQEDMAITLMTFSIAVLDGLQQFRIEVDTEKQEAYIHTWAAIGSLLGIQEDLLPQSVAEARHLLSRILERQAAPSEAGRLLTKALVSFSEKNIPRERFDPAAPALVRYLVGEKLADILGVYPGPGCFGFIFPAFLRSLFKMGESLEDRIKKQPHRELIEWLSRQSVEAMVRYFDNYKNKHFEVPEALQKAWNIKIKN